MNIIKETTDEYGYKVIQELDPQTRKLIKSTTFQPDGKSIWIILTNLTPKQEPKPK
ncbi:DUF2963 domain-containing protein [Candidatus Phytoplasma solani]|uniref:DUF2963 domain-containing protein n=1 Tax=Candidatus Phytoplasma solani TaxID=69896 RepID=UPI0032DA19A1